MSEQYKFFSFQTGESGESKYSVSPDIKIAESTRSVPVYEAAQNIVKRLPLPTDNDSLDFVAWNLAIFERNSKVKGYTVIFVSRMLQGTMPYNLGPFTDEDYYQSRRNVISQNGVHEQSTPQEQTLDRLPESPAIESV